jgi:hypothetical protein
MRRNGCREKLEPRMTAVVAPSSSFPFPRVTIRASFLVRGGTRRTLRRTIRGACGVAGFSGRHREPDFGRDAPIGALSREPGGA